MFLLDSLEERLWDDKLKTRHRQELHIFLQISGHSQASSRDNYFDGEVGESSSCLQNISQDYSDIP